MKARMLVYMLLVANVACAKEWSKLKHYKAATGTDTLAEGQWLKKDRKKNTPQWTGANEYHISTSTGYENYVTFAQKRDFYKWFDETIHDKGHEVRWAGIAYIVTKRLRYLDRWFIKKVVVRDNELVSFTKQCNNLILEYIYADLGELYQTTDTLTGAAARSWDEMITRKEQCTLLDTLYEKQPPRVLKKLNRMAGGKGVYGIMMPAALRIKNDIKDCNNRVYYGLHTIAAYYDKQHMGKN